MHACVPQHTRGYRLDLSDRGPRERTTLAGCSRLRAPDCLQRRLFLLLHQARLRLLLKLVIRVGLQTEQQRAERQ